MAIAAISGSSGSMQPVRTSMAPIKGVGNEQGTKKAEEMSVVAQENKDRALKPGIDNQKMETDNQKLENLKGIQKVDTLA